MLMSKLKACKNAIIKKERKSTELEINPMFFHPIEYLELIPWIQDTLKRNNIRYVGDLVIKGEHELQIMFLDDKEMMNTLYAFVFEIDIVYMPVGLKTKARVESWYDDRVVQKIGWHTIKIKNKLSEKDLWLGMKTKWPSDPKEVEDLIKKHNKQEIVKRADRGEWA